MAAVFLQRLCRRGNVAKVLLHFRTARPASSNPGSLFEGLTRQFSVLGLQGRDCKVGSASPFGLQSIFSARGLQEQALAVPDACEHYSYEDVDSQAAALALQHHLQNHSKAYLSDAASVVDRAPLFVQRLVDLVKQKSQEPALVIEEEVSTPKAKRKKKGNAKPAQPVGELDFEKQVRAFLSATDVNLLEPIVESLGMAPERREALLQKLSAEEAVDVQSLLFVTRWIEQLGFSRSSVGDIIEKDIGVLSYKSEEIKAGVAALKELSVSEEEMSGLIMRYPLILKADFVDNMRALDEELRELSSKDAIIRKAILDNPVCIQQYVKGCADGVLQFLRSYSLKDERLDSFVRRDYRLVFSDVETKFKCNVKFLRDLGVSRKIIGTVIHRCPRFLLQSLETNLMARLEYFKSLGFTEAEFALLVSRYPEIFGASLVNRIKPIVEELKTLGLTEAGLKKVVIYRPSLFACKVGEEVSALIAGLKETNYSENQKVTAFIKLFSRGIDHRKRCEDCLTQHGLSASEAKQVLDKEPSILGYSEKAISLRIDHLTQTLGLSVQNVVWVPEYLSSGFKSCILRRQRVLAYMKTKGLLADSLTLKQLISPSNIQFYDTFVKPNGEDREISKIWLKDRKGMGEVEGLSFIQNYVGSDAKAQQVSA